MWILAARVAVAVVVILAVAVFVVFVVVVVFVVAGDVSNFVNIVRLAVVMVADVITFAVEEATLSCLHSLLEILCGTVAEVDSYPFAVEAKLYQTVLIGNIYRGDKYKRNCGK